MPSLRIREIAFARHALPHQTLIVRGWDFVLSMLVFGLDAPPLGGRASEPALAPSPYDPAPSVERGPYRLASPGKLAPSPYDPGLPALRR